MRHAQTILQLFEQLRADGWSEDALSLVRRAYELARRLYACRIQASGKPFIDHGVGAASVLACYQESPELVASGLIHNAYVNGDFGPELAGDLAGQREAITRGAGEAVEAIVMGFRELTVAMAAAGGRVDPQPFGRAPIVLLLAESLEKCKDRDLLFARPSRTHYAEPGHFDAMIEMGRMLGEDRLVTELASELEAAARDLARARIPECFQFETLSLVIPPRSLGRASRTPNDAIAESIESDRAEEAQPWDLRADCARTRGQLLTQLAQSGYSADEQLRVSRAYDLLIELLGGRRRPNGCSHVAHAVGTASLLAGVEAPVELVTIGLVHAAYRHGDFGEHADGITSAKRKELEAKLGSHSEERICRYTDAFRTRESFCEAAENVSRLDEIDRDVLLVRIANELDEQLDSGILYSVPAADLLAVGERDGSTWIGLARELGHGKLAAALEDGLAQTREQAVEFPAALRGLGTCRADSRTLPPSLGDVETDL